jgi:hypothetical protein
MMIGLDEWIAGEARFAAGAMAGAISAAASRAQALQASRASGPSARM